MKNNSLYEYLLRWIFIIFLFIAPIFFLPVTQEYYETSKWFLLLGVAMVALLFSALSLVKSHRLAIAMTPGALAFGILTASALLSLLFASTNKIEALMSPMGLGTFASLTILSLLATAGLNDSHRHALRWGLFLGDAVLSLVAIYQHLGLGKMMFPNVSLLSDPLWTPAGTSLALIGVLTIMLPLVLREIRHEYQSKEDWQTIVLVVLAVMSLGAIAVTSYRVVPLLPSLVLPFGMSWTVMLEMLKNLRQALVGVGAQNYLTAFTSARPVTLNATTLWNTRFTGAGSFALHEVTTMGLMGVIGLGAIAWLLLKLWIQDARTTTRATLIIIFLTIIFLPPNMTLIATVAGVVLLLTPHSPEQSKSLVFPSKSVAWIVGILLIAITGTMILGLVRAYTAEVIFANGLKFLDRREGTPAYTRFIRTLELNGYITRYHMTYSKTSLALADSISKSVGSDATEGSSSASGALPPKKDREMATQLVQQAIREAKIAVNLAPNSVLAWENLAEVYGALTGIARGSDKFAVASYQRAVQLDPTNPLLRLRLGGAYVGNADFERARDAYRTAIALKPDWANAYYNLAFVYRQEKDFYNAAVATKQAQSLVDPESGDAVRLENELMELRQLLRKEDVERLDSIATQSGAPKQGDSFDELNRPSQPLTPSLPPAAIPPETVQPQN